MRWTGMGKLAAREEKTVKLKIHKETSEGRGQIFVFGIRALAYPHQSGLKLLFLVAVASLRV